MDQAGHWLTAVKALLCHHGRAHDSPDLVDAHARVLRIDEFLFKTGGKGDAAFESLSPGSGL